MNYGELIEFVDIYIQYSKFSINHIYPGYMLESAWRLQYTRVNSIISRRNTVSKKVFIY